MSSNAYAERIAPKAKELLPATITLETNSNWPGEIIWHHEAGARGLIVLSLINRGAVDNRRIPTESDVARLVELVTNNARSQANDHRYTDKARATAQLAWADFT